MVHMAYTFCLRVLFLLFLLPWLSFKHWFLRLNYLYLLRHLGFSSYLRLILFESLKVVLYEFSLPFFSLWFSLRTSTVLFLLDGTCSLGVVLIIDWRIFFGTPGLLSPYSRSFTIFFYCQLILKTGFLESKFLLLRSTSFYHLIFQRD